MSQFIDENCHYYFGKSLKDSRRAPHDNKWVGKKQIKDGVVTWRFACQEYCHSEWWPVPGNYSVWKLCDTWHLWHVWEDGGGTVTVHYADNIHQTYCYNLIDWLDICLGTARAFLHVTMWRYFLSWRFLIYGLNVRCDVVVKIIAGI